MTIGGIGGNTNAGTGAGPVSMNGQGMDAYSKSLQKQIADAQKQLQELAQNDEMTPEIKMKKRQEIQKQISDLNMQLRQHQMEVRKKAQEEKQPKNEPKKTEENMTGMSQKSMEVIISAEGSMKQAKVQGSVATSMEGRAGVLKAEIKYSTGDVEKKKEELADVEQKAQAATASQMSTLAEANNKLSEANAENSTDTKVKERSDDKTKTEGEATDETAATEEVESETVLAAGARTVTVTEASEPDAAPVSKTQTAETGSNVDVRI